MVDLNQDRHPKNTFYLASIFLILLTTTFGFPMLLQFFNYTTRIPELIILMPLILGLITALALIAGLYLENVILRNIIVFGVLALITIIKIQDIPGSSGLGAIGAIIWYVIEYIFLISLYLFLKKYKYNQDIRVYLFIFISIIVIQIIISAGNLFVQYEKNYESQADNMEFNNIDSINDYCSKILTQPTKDYCYISALNEFSVNKFNISIDYCNYIHKTGIRNNCVLHVEYILKIRK